MDLHLHETPEQHAGLPKHHVATHDEKLIITASSLGTVFEWYDFYLYGLLTAIIAAQFLTGLNPTTSYIMALLVFAAGFIVRPFGALVFGRIGDMVGRRYTFIITLVVMGLSTFLVGCLPTYKTAGVLAPILLVVLRMFQGLALGGEYGGAATYVAEHAPEGKRGLYTSWIQITATAGLAMALLIVILVRSPVTGVGEEAFKQWGWRIPYLVSGLFLCVGLWLQPEAARKPRLPEDEGRGQCVEAAVVGSLRRMEEPQDRADRLLRRNRRSGGGVVHRPALRDVLP